MYSQMHRYLRRDEDKPKNASVSQNLQVEVRKIEDEKPRETIEMGVTSLLSLSSARNRVLQGVR